MHELVKRFADALRQAQSILDVDSLAATLII